MGSYAPLHPPLSSNTNENDRSPFVYTTEKVDHNDEIYAPPSTIEGYPRGLIVKRLSIASLLLSWVAGIAGVVVGVLFISQSFSDYNAGWVPISLNRNVREIIPLLLNVFIATLEYSMGFIHAAALRWALAQGAGVSDNGLTFNSNLRLFRYPKGYRSMGFLSNMLNGGFMALVYTATSILFSILQIGEGCELDNGDCIPGASLWCPSAILALGIGLLGQVFLTICQFNAVKTPSWNTSPIATAWTCAAEAIASPRPGRCMAAVHDSVRQSGPQSAIRQQRSIYTAHKQARRVLRFLWAVVVYCLLWFIVLYVGIAKVFQPQCNDEGTCITATFQDWSLIPDWNDSDSYAKIAYRNSDTDSGGVGNVFLTMITLMAFQALLTMGLHCAELLVNLSRDEETWRKATTSKGYRDQNAIVSAITSWKMLFLFAAKPVVHWMFGLAIQFCYPWGLVLRPPQTLYLSIVMLLIAICGTFLCLQKPKGPQPATFGHVQTLVDLIDVYDDNLFWGDKKQWYDASRTPHIRHAGTWGRPLPPVHYNVPYS